MHSTIPQIFSYPYIPKHEIKDFSSLIHKEQNQQINELPNTTSTHNQTFKQNHYARSKV